MRSDADALNTFEKWDKDIGPHRNLFDLRLRELWHSYDLIMLFVRRDFVSTYTQTILGPLWYLIQPVLTTIIFTIIFGGFAQLSTEGLPKFLFYMSGVIIWTYFASCLTKISDTFINNAQLFGKVYFPRLAVPVSIVISSLIAFVIQYAFFLVSMIFFALRGFELHPNWLILLTPLLLFIMAGLGLGFGIIISSLTTKYRDLRFLVQFGVQLLMFATPVIYPVSSIPIRFQKLIMLNPLSAVLETFRYAYLGEGTISLGQLAYSFGFMLAAILIGAVIFNRVETTFMDTV